MLRVLLQASRSEIFSNVRELVRQFGRISVDDCRQLCENVRKRLGGIWIMAHGDFDHCQSNRPHIRGDGVRSDIILRLSFDTFGLK
jgi:hypothetical protein